MLKSLYIQQYALIEQLSIRFYPGFSVITGETGAGKSIILGAIALLLGQRADSRTIRHGASKCVIEATFDLSAYGMEQIFADNELEFDNGECIIRREFTATGKSRSFINDTPVPLALLKDLGEQLIDVHSQHQNLLLGKENFQLEVLDILADDAAEKTAFTQAYQAFRSLEKQWHEAEELLHRNQAEEDYLRFQWQQLNEADLNDPQEQMLLEAEQDVLSHAEDIKQNIFQAKAPFFDEEHGILAALKNSVRTLRSINEVFAESEDWCQRLESSYIELKDVADEMDDKGEEIEFNPTRMEWVENRLSTIYSLQQKHHVETLEQLMTVRDELHEKIQAIDGGEDNVQRLADATAKARKAMMEQARQLTAKRQQSAAKVEKAMTDYLVPLGIPNVQFKINLQPRDTPDATGADKVCFLFSANKKGELQDLSHVASGGEIARVMLSLKAMIAGAVKLPTIIFDEIDTGVSGKIAEKMAQMMQEMGGLQRQVISITHLPQIAAYGAHHYKVYKEDVNDETLSHIIELNHEQRVEEIANMLSGASRSDAAINNAKELLNTALKTK